MQTAKPMTKYHRVLVADDHDLVRKGIRRTLELIPGIQIVDEAKTGLQALEMAHLHQPDLVMMDIRMPDLDGLEATRRITGELRSTSVLILTSHEGSEYLLKAIRNGAAGYLLKDAPQAEFRETVEAVLAGESPINPELMHRALTELANEVDHKRAAPSHTSSSARDGMSFDDLSDREREALALAAKGYTNERIASTMYVSPHTVKGYMARILEKLQVANRAAAAAKAGQYGILQEQENS